MDTEQRTGKNDSIDATQDATTHHPDEKKIQKKIERQDIEPKEEKGIVDITENCSTDDESDDGQSTKSKDDVDSEVTFDEDPDKEMDTMRLKKRIGSNTSKEALLTHWTRWNVQRFVAGTGHTKK